MKRILVLGLIFLGLVDTAFLTYEHYFGGVVLCPAHLTLVDCGQVLRSQYSVFLGVPLVLWGLGYYLFLLAVFLYAPRFFRAVVWVGLAVSVVLFYLQIVVLKSVCFYCLLSELIILLLFVFTMRPISSILDAWRKES